MIWSNEDADFAPGLNGVDLLYPLKAHRNVLQILKATQMCFGLITASAWSCGADGVSNLHDWCLARCALHLLMVRGDRVDDPVGHTVAACQIGTDCGVRPLNLVIECLPNVMQKSANLGGANIHAELTGNSAGNLCCFN